MFIVFWKLNLVGINVFGKRKIVLVCWRDRVVVCCLINWVNGKEWVYWSNNLKVVLILLDV